MTISTATLQHIAQLARLAITEEEQSQYAQQLSRVLDLMQQLQEVPTENIPPMSHAIITNLPERPDGVTHGNRREQMLQNAPEQEEGCFRVPKIIE